MRRCEHHGYRGASLDYEALFSAFSDPRSRLEIRAAAAYALLFKGHPAHVEAVRARITPSSPPLVLRMVQCAARGESMVSNVVLEAALSYLDEDDRPSLR